MNILENICVYIYVKIQWLFTRMSDFVQFVGLDEAAAGQLITDLGWTFNQQTGIKLSVIRSLTRA